MIEGFVYDVFLVSSIMSVAAVAVIFSYQAMNFFQQKIAEFKLKGDDEKG